MGPYAQAGGWIVFVIVVIVVVAAASNGANLTDGLDGLCCGNFGYYLCGSCHLASSEQCHLLDIP